MADDIHHLVLSPFREIVTKGKQALENATATTEDNSEPMAKAAQSLINNAERALKKIEPVCQRQLTEYESVFIDALKENDEVTHFREQLNDMIWDLDDCIEVDSFSPEIYTKLQALLRTAALKISDIVVRMKLGPQQQQHSHLPDTPITPISERPRTPSIIVSPSSVSSPMEAKAGPVQGWDEGEEQAAVASASAVGNEIKNPESPAIKTPTIHLEPVPAVPPEPREDPWRGSPASSETLSLQIHSLRTEDAVIQRRPRVGSNGQHDTEPVSPLTPDNEAVTPPFRHSPLSSPSRDDIVSPLDEDPRNSFILSSEHITGILSSPSTGARNSEPRTLPQMNSSHGDEDLASPSSVYSEYNNDDTYPGKVVVVPDTEGLIPVEGEYDTNHPIHSTQQEQQQSDQNPSVIVIINPLSKLSEISPQPPPPAEETTKGNKFHTSPPPPPLLLNLAPGSRIINVSFPAQYNGEWAIGWDSTNQMKGLFPVDCVKVEMPTGEDADFFRGMGGGDKSGGGGGISLGIGIGRKKGHGRSSSVSGLFSGSGNGNNGLSGLSAVARWGFHVGGGPPGGSTTSSGSSATLLRKEKERSGFSFGGGGGSGSSGGSGNNSSDGLQWLKFDKGEVITGVCFPHSQHWCWAGYNSKKKWGIFLRAFMTPGTLLEEAPSNLLQLLHKEGNNRPQYHQKPQISSPATGSGGSGSGSGWATSPSSSSPVSGGGATNTLFSRISSKGLPLPLPLPLGLRRLSNGTGTGNGNGNSPTTTSSSGTGTGTGRRDTTGSGSGSSTLSNDWARRPSDGEPTPDSPSGSFYTHNTHTRGSSAGSGSTTTTTRSPRPSLY